MLDAATYERAVVEAQEGRPRLFAETLLSVRSKTNDIIPFGFPAIIDDLDRREGHYSITCKPRQVFVSSYHLAKAFALCASIPFFQAAIVAHERGATERLFRTVRNFHEFLPDKVKPKLNTDRQDYLEFEHTKSLMYVGTAGGRKFGRAETINYLVLSEMAHYEPLDAEEIWTGATDAVPKGGWIIIESTPNGIGNLFHTLYVDACEGKTRYQPFFYPWFRHEEYTLGPNDPETLAVDRIPDGDLILVPEEEDLALRHNLTRGQVRWRRSKKAEKREKFAQEFPEDDVSCFIATTRTVYPAVILQEMVRNAEEPREVRDSGRLRIWRYPHPSHQYIIGVDPSEGLPSGDPACAQVVDALDGRKVAVLHGPIPVLDLALKVVQLGEEYNHALVVPERNNHGLAFIQAVDRLSYTRMYRHRERDGTLGRHGVPIFDSTKVDSVSHLRAAIESGDLVDQDKDTLRELIEYQVDDKGRYTAPPGRHDDREAALRMAWYGRLMQPGLAATAGAAARRKSVALYPEGW